MIFKRTDDLSESEPRMTPDYKNFSAGQNFSVPLHDDAGEIYKRITTGLVMVQPDFFARTLVDELNANPNPALEWLTVPYGVTCHSNNGCALSNGANRTYHIGVGEYFLEVSCVTVYRYTSFAASP